MFKFVNAIALFTGFAALTPSVFAEDTVAASCDIGAGGAAIMVHVENIRSIEGNLRAQIYSSNPDDFLAKGKKLVRVDVPVQSDEGQSVCVQLPAPGDYALVVMHDKNSNGKADFFSEGFGFSNNPKLGFGAPDAEDVIMKMPAGVSETVVNLKYILGSDNKKKEKRRNLRRR